LATQPKARTRENLSMKKRNAIPPNQTADTWADPHPKRILVPLDFSEPSKRAARFAREWAKLFGAHIYLLHVIEPATFLSGLEDVPIAMSRHDVAQTAKSALEKIARGELPKTTPVSVLVRKGKAYDQIVKTARSLQIDLIIIPTHGYQGLERAMLGSTAERVVRLAPCPVLTVRRRSR
jgi:nucleotide-binding universal stress UspA family protein